MLISTQKAYSIISTEYVKSARSGRVYARPGDVLSEGDLHDFSLIGVEYVQTNYGLLRIHDWDYRLWIGKHDDEKLMPFNSFLGRYEDKPHTYAKFK